METETYKVAKDLLDEFASDQEKRALNVNIRKELNERSKNWIHNKKYFLDRIRLS